MRRTHRQPTIALACILAALSLVGGAFAQDSPPPSSQAPPGWTSERPADLTRYRLTEISFEGDFELAEAELRDGVRSPTSSFFRFRAPDPERLDGDAQRLRYLLRRHGYWDARVSYAMWFHGDERARVVFTIDDGVQRVVGSILPEGNEAFPAKEIREWIQQKEKEPFNLSDTARDRAAIENEYANAGFFEVNVVADIQPSDIETSPLVHDVVYRITEGTRYTVNQVHVEGNAFTDATIIRRELTFETGDVLNRERLEGSRRNLYGTGYFARVEIEPENLGANEGSVDVLVRVIERKMRFVGVGIGYGTRDQLRLSGEWGHRNFLGRGKRASIEAILATELFPVDLVRTRLEGRYVEPWLFNTRTTGTTELFYERSREQFQETRDGMVEEGAYDLSLVGLIMNVNRRLAHDTRGWLALENTWADVDADPGTTPPDESQPDLTRSLSAIVERDRRDDFFEPHSGFLHRVIASISGGPLGGDNDFWKSQVEASTFARVFRTTLAGRVRLGYERVFGESNVIPDRERFKLGGATSVRGYEFQEIGPGDFLILVNVEDRFPLFWILEGGVFLDGGNAWESVGEVRWKDFRLTDAKDDPARARETEFRYGVGAGIRAATPVGPVRLDYGYKLKILPPEEGASTEDRWALHLSLGHVF